MGGSHHVLILNTQVRLSELIKRPSIYSYFKDLTARLKLKALFVPTPITWTVYVNVLLCSRRMRFHRPIKTLDRLIEAKLRIKEMKNGRKYHPLYAALYKARKRFEATVIWASCYALFLKHPNALIGLWNGAKFRSRIVYMVAKALRRRVVFFENGVLPNTTTVDDLGINYNNSLPRDKQFYLRAYAKNAAQDVLQLPTQLQIPKAKFRRTGSGANVSNKYIFVPFQVNTDSQILEHSPWIKGMRHLFTVLQQISSKISDQQLQLVIKEHPQCPQEYPDLYEIAKTQERIVFANFNPTQELIEKAAGIITINSTVGWEALLLKKKVITLGNACYNLPDLVLPVKDKKGLINAINRLDAWQPNERLRRAFLHYVYRTYCIPDDWRSPTERHWRAVNARLTKMVANEPWL